MKNQIFLLLAFLFFTISPISSQVNLAEFGESHFPSKRSFPSSPAEIEKEKEKFLNEVPGSRFIDDEFVPIKINDHKDFLVGRYDAFNDAFQVKIRDSKIFYVKKSLGNKITLLVSDDVYGVFHDKKNNKSNFYKILKQGKASLLVKEKVIFKEGKPKNSYDLYKTPAFKRSKDKLYISFDGLHSIEVPANKKKFVELFKDQSNELMSYIASNNLNIRKTKDLEMIIDFYNSL